jgi:hypothetical protein
VTGLWLPLALVALILPAAGAVGYPAARFLVPPSALRAERAAWGFSLGLLVLMASVPVAFITHLPPRWMAIVLAVLTVAIPLFQRETEGLRGAHERPNPKSEIRNPKFELLLLLLAAAGVLLYCLRALTEPMWSNDFVAIWGLKGKILHLAGEIPRRLFSDPALEFSHPEYPLGLPFLYAALAFLLGRWDDHAMALLFPAFQGATLLALYGWLRRRGTSRIVTLAAVALLAHFEPLYSAFQTGLADVPYSFAVLLFGTALIDSLEGTDPFAARRLALASVLAISTKNEGLFLASAGAVLWVFGGRKVRASRGTVLAIAVPALVLVVGGRIMKGELPLSAFDFAYLGPTHILEFLPRLSESFHTGLREVILPSWPGALGVAVLIVAGRRDPSGDRMLVLAGLCALVYLLLPSLAVLGPAWMIRTSFSRTLSALAPLAAAALAVRWKD